MKGNFWDSEKRPGSKGFYGAHRHEKHKKAEKDRIPGGKADGEPDSKFPAKELKKGQKHEKEHTSDPAVAKEIAKDHVKEDSKYYEKLEKVEKKK
jgi:hypothetical protein